MTRRNTTKYTNFPLTTQEAAKLLKVTPDTICDYIARDWLPAIRVGKQWLIRLESVLHILEHGTPTKKAGDK